MTEKVYVPFEEFEKMKGGYVRLIDDGKNPRYVMKVNDVMMNGPFVVGIGPMLYRTDGEVEFIPERKHDIGIRWYRIDDDFEEYEIYVEAVDKDFIREFVGEFISEMNGKMEI